MDEADVRLDGEDEESPQQAQSSQSFGISQVWGGFNMVASKITDFTIQFVPPGTPVIVVDRCVKLGLVLGAVAIIRSFLSVILTIGSIGLALYVATRVFGVQIFSEAGSAQDEEPRAPRSGRRLPPKRQRRGGGEEDVIDVWYDK